MLTVRQTLFSLSPSQDKNLYQANIIIWKIDTLTRQFDLILIDWQVLSAKLLVLQHKIVY